MWLHPRLGMRPAYDQTQMSLFSIPRVCDSARNFVAWKGAGCGKVKGAPPDTSPKKVSFVAPHIPSNDISPSTMLNISFLLMKRPVLVVLSMTIREGMGAKITDTSITGEAGPRFYLAQGSLAVHGRLVASQR